jgi:hypothetical protein
MSWTEAQKAYAKKELIRRRTFETRATYRKSFLLAIGWCSVCQVVAALALHLFLSLPDLNSRGSTIVLVDIAIAVAGGIVGAACAAALAYVRWLDWRRTPALEQRG